MSINNILHEESNGYKDRYVAYLKCNDFFTGNMLKESERILRVLLAVKYDVDIYNEDGVRNPEFERNFAQFLSVLKAEVENSLMG